MPQGKSMGRGKHPKALEFSDRELFVFRLGNKVSRYRQT